MTKTGNSQNGGSRMFPAIKPGPGSMYSFCWSGAAAAQSFHMLGRQKCQAGERLTVRNFFLPPYVRSPPPIPNKSKDIIHEVVAHDALDSH